MGSDLVKQKIQYNEKDLLANKIRENEDAKPQNLLTFPFYQRY